MAHLLVLLLLASSCTRGTLWHQYAHVGPEGWQASDTLFFDLPPAPHDGTYAIQVELRTTPAYAFQQLCVERQTILTNPDTCFLDTIAICTSADGTRLTGQGLTMQSFSQAAPPLHLQKDQQARIVLRHIMRRTPMPHVLDVGVKVNTPYI